MQAAQKRLAAPKDDPFADGVARATLPRGSARPKSSAINSALVLHVSYGYVAAGEKDFPHRAEVRSLVNHFDPNVAGATCTAIIGKDDAIAAPGMSVLVRLNTGTMHDNLFLPQQTLFSDRGKQFVYIVHVGNVVEPRAVEAGPWERGSLTGVNRNDIVIADPSAVKPGMVVRPDFISRVLQSPTPPIEFVETPLKYAVEYLEDACHIQIKIDERGLAAVGIMTERPVHLHYPGRFARVRIEAAA